MSAQSALSFVEARQDHTFWGRLVESAVGAHLLNGIRGTPIELTYWCEGDREVDFVLQRGDRLLPIEVKSNSDGLGQSGMDTFLKRFGPCPTLLVGDQGMPLDQFLRASVPELLS